MKKSILILCLIACSSVVNAGIYVNWTTTGGYTWSGDPAAGLVPEGSGQSVLFQLIWSQDNVADAARSDTVDFVSGDDILLTSTVVTETGSNFDYYFYGLTLDGGYSNESGIDYQTTYGVDGYLYGRLFQDTTPGDNEWYYTGSVAPAVNADFGAAQPPTAQGYDMTIAGEAELGGINFNYVDGTYGAQVQPVPEPATMALFALGLATLGISRKRKTCA